MITDTDIKKLKTVFATKEDLFGLQGEFGELRGEFRGLQGEFVELRGEFRGLREDFVDLKVEVGDINDRLDSIVGEMHEMNARYDRTIGGLEEQRIENGVQAIVMRRHERQRQALAAGTGVEIPED